MICQSCGKCIPLRDTWILKFHGNLISINATWIACKNCCNNTLSDLYAFFPTYYVDQCVECYKAKGD